MPRSNLSFLGKYRKDELVRYLASLHLYAQNSSNILRLSMMVYEALCGKGGRKHLHIPTFQKEIEKNYSHDMYEDPQEYMFVDLVHTPKGSYRVYPGIFTFLQYNLTRLFELAEAEHVEAETLSSVYALLELSDTIAQKTGKGRYDMGDKEHVELYCSNYQETNTYESVVSFSKRDLEILFSKYGLEPSFVQTLVFHSRSKDVKHFKMTMDGYSPVEKTPLYADELGNCVVIQPSSLLSCAYLHCLEILRERLGKEKLNRRYLDVLMGEVALTMKQTGTHNCGGGIKENIGYLLFTYDNGAKVCITIAHQKYDEKNYNQVKDIAKKQYPNDDLLYVDIKSSLSMNIEASNQYFDHVNLLIDDFKVMMAQKHMNATELYYYSQARKRLSGHNIGQEIDMFAFYWDNKHTFYRDQTYDFYSFETGLAYDIRCQYLTERDEHLVDGPGHLMMICHFDDYPKEIPIYVPIGNDSPKVFVGEYGNTRLTTILHTRDNDEVLGLREIAKSLVVWTYGFTYKNGVELLNRKLKLMLSFYDGTNPKMKQLDDDFLEFSIPRKVFERKPKGKTYDYLFFDYWIEALLEFGLCDVEAVKEKSDVLFEECKGELLLIEPKGIVYWAENDGHQATYFTNDNACDRVLDDIAAYLKMGGTPKALDLKESKALALKIIDFLGTTLNDLLSQYATSRFVESLMELHHGTLFWLASTSMRFEKVNAVMTYLGADYSEQKAYLFKYSETNNLTQCLLERIVANHFHSENDPKLVDIDKIFAYMHELYTFGIYLDFLTFKIPGTELAILANGRVGLPQEQINKQMAYFSDMRENELYRPDSYRKLHAMQKSPNIDTKDENFLDAFKEEYHIEYSQWKKLLEESLNYAIGHGEPIVNITWMTFVDEILLKVITDEDVEPFKKIFCMYKGMSEGALPSESFSQRFNRKYQISSRPWVCYRDCVMYSTKSLHQHEHVMLERLDEGKVHAEAQKMSNYMSDLNRRKGIVFENNLRNYYDSLGIETLLAFRGVEIGPGERLENKEPLGDIDVLLIDTKCKKIVCIETKDYYESRTIYEVLTENRKTSDDMEMPIKRDEWCKSHISAFAGLCQEVDDTYTCSSVFVTVNMPAYQYGHSEEKSPIRIIPALDLMEDPMVVFEDEEG